MRGGAKATPEKACSVVPASLSPKWNACAVLCPPRVKSQKATPGAAGLLFHTNEFVIADVYDSFYIQFLRLILCRQGCEIMCPRVQEFPFILSALTAFDMLHLIRYLLLRRSPLICAEERRHINAETHYGRAERLYGGRCPWEARGCECSRRERFRGRAGCRRLFLEYAFQ